MLNNYVEIAIRFEKKSRRKIGSLIWIPIHMKIKDFYQKVYILPFSIFCPDVFQLLSCPMPYYCSPQK